jgi:metal-sulfur cluster biosynthetic enzyme
MQAFTVKRQNGVDTTTAIDQALMKTFKDAPAIDLAIQAGIVNEGEIVSTIEDDKPHTLPIDQLRDLQEDVRQLQEEQGSGVSDKISTNATSSNRCPAASEVTSEISSAIQSLDVASVGGNGKYIKAIEETNGKISATEETFDTAVTQNSTKGVSSGAVYTAIANASSGSASSLANETTARQNADTALGERIDDVDDKISTNATSSDRCPAASEVTSEISSAISDEATDRDTAIGNAISTEVTNRNDAISSAITDEVSNRNTAITNAINGLDVAAAGGTGKFIKAISQADGKISATEGTLSMKLEGNDLYITFA